MRITRKRTSMRMMRLRMDEHEGEEDGEQEDEDEAVDERR